VETTTRIDSELLPHNEEAERSVVGAALIDPDAIPRVASILEPGDFYKAELREIWNAMLDLHNQSEPVDMLTVCDELERRQQLDELGGPAFITALTNEVPTSIHAEHYAKMVAKDATRRRLLDAAGRLAKAASDQGMELADVEDLALKLVVEARSTGNGRMQSLSRIARAYYDKIEALARDGKKPGLPTGFHKLDELLGGMQRSDLIILAGRPGMGKTGLAACIVHNIVKASKRILFLSLEMSSEQLMRRLISLESGIGITALRDGTIADDDWPKFIQATAAMDLPNLLIDDTAAITPSHARALALKAEAEIGPLDLIVIDYIGLMKSDERAPNRYTALTNIGQALKKLAKDLNVPILALSQVNRDCENRTDKRPQTHDLRDSGDLEQTANVVLLLYRDEVYDDDAMPGIAEVAVGKNRDGKTGTAHLRFIDYRAQFASTEITVRNIGEVL